MSDDLILQQELFQTEKGGYVVCKAQYKGELCYCIQHIDGEEKYTALFDYDNQILKAVIQKMKRVNILMDKKESGSGFLFRFHRTSHEAGVSLRSFLWAKYNNLPLKKIRRVKVELSDKSSFPERIMDMRKGNLYDAGGIDTEGISVAVCPVTNDKYIMVQDGSRIEYMDYSPELYQILTTRSICGKCRMRKDKGRLYTVIHHSSQKDGWMILNLSRLVLLYSEFFPRYKNQKRGNITRFVRSIPQLNGSISKDAHCSHLNAHSWNNCIENIVFMDSEVNQQMSSYARRISGNYRMFPIAWRSNGKTKILIEWYVNRDTRYFVCDSVEDYLDFQETVLGKNKVIQNLRINYVSQSGEQTPILTPKQSAKSMHEKDQSPDAKTISIEMWDWSISRDRVLKVYQDLPELFWKWRNTKNRIANDVLINQILRLF